MQTKKVFAGLGAIAVLGATIIPMTSYAEGRTGTVNVDLVVNSTLSMSLDGTAMSADTIGRGNDISASILGAGSNTEKTTTAVVSTNSTSGYTLSVAAKDQGSNSYGLSGSAGTIANANIDSASEGWALKTTHNSTTSDWQIFPTSGTNAGKLTLATESTVKENDSTVITYGFKTSSDTVPGTYSTVLTYTATSID